MSDSSKSLTTLEEVQAQVGQLPAPRDMKVIDFLDSHAREWVSCSTLVFLGFAEGKNLQLTAAGGAAGFIQVSDEHRLEIPLASLDHPEMPQPNMAFGSLLFVPQMNETLRINGRVEALGQSISLKVEECYLHCGKALLRANFWHAEKCDPEAVHSMNFLSKSSLMLLATMSEEGQVDVSPKGDPSNLLLRKIGKFIWFADRPGNRRIDSFRNIVTNPQVALIALVPGSSDYANVRGAAEICLDETVQAQFSVKEQLPNLVVRVENAEQSLTSSTALEQFGKTKDLAPQPPTNAPEIFRTHIKLSKERSLGAKVLRAFVSVPGVLRKGIEADYKKNMY